MAAVGSYRLLSLSLVTCGLLVALSEGESELSKIGGRGSLARLVRAPRSSVHLSLSLSLSPPPSPSLSLSPSPSLPLSPPSLSPPLSLQGYQLEVVGLYVKSAQQELMLIGVSHFSITMYIHYLCAPTVSKIDHYHFRTSFIRETIVYSL